jgi:hypothetical protein
MEAKNFRHLDMMGEGYHKPAYDHEYRGQILVSAKIRMILWGSIISNNFHLTR